MTVGASGTEGGAPERRGELEDREIERLRQNIDEVDAVLVKLLNQRARWALEIGDVKRNTGAPIYQPDREARVVAHVESINRGPLSGEAIRRLFERVIDENRRLERTGEA